MKIKTPLPQSGYRVDRKGWPPGEWDWEPDRIEWRRGQYPCLLRRRERYGFWCGYVGVPYGHPWYRLPPDRIHARVHGFIDYAGPCNPAEFICHDPAPGDPDDVWWVGFSCGYQQDLRPGIMALAKAVITGWRKQIPQGAVYRDMAWAKRETIALADQADEAWNDQAALTPPTAFNVVAVRPQDFKPRRRR